jgi:aminoglycoside phosphotransferase (APT) family kinase protein
MEVDAGLVAELVQAQFPQWAGLDVRPVVNGGWDNRTFRMGQDLVVRLPSAQAYSAQVEREHRWLGRLAPRLSLPIPELLGLGAPALGFPWKWSVRRWLPGETAVPERIGSVQGFALELAGFLRSLQSAPSEGGPEPGPDTCFRGASLAVYDAQTRQAVRMLGRRLDAQAVAEVWEAALATKWTTQPVWVHGDMGVGNLLVSDGKLCGVIDFGQFCVGDPACDLAPASTLFDAKAREAFRTNLPLDQATWARGRGWVLWKALIVAARLTNTTAWEGVRCWKVVENVLADHAQDGA